MDTTMTTVRQILADVTHNDAVTQMSLDTKLREDLGIDSMISLTFLIALEEEIPGFTLDAATLEAAHFETIGSIGEYVKLQLASAQV